MAKTLTENEQMAYRAGFIDGLKAFAHWKNGRQLVGTCGTELKDAIDDLTGNWNYRPRVEQGGT